MRYPRGPVPARVPHQHAAWFLLSSVTTSEEAGRRVKGKPCGKVRLPAVQSRVGEKRGKATFTCYCTTVFSPLKGVILVLKALTLMGTCLSMQPPFPERGFLFLNAKKA